MEVFVNPPFAPSASWHRPYRPSPSFHSAHVRAFHIHQELVRKEGDRDFLQDLARDGIVAAQRKLEADGVRKWG